MVSASAVTVLTALLLVSASSAQGLRIMAFNVRQFGESKFSNVEVVNDLVQVRGGVCIARELRSAGVWCRYSGSMIWGY